MKKKLFAGFLATALAMSMTVTAFANEVDDFTGGANVGGEGTVLAVQDVYDVIVPTNVNYAINPDELSGKPQIMSGDFGVINHGSTNVQVAVAASVNSSTVTMSDADTIAAINNATEASAVNDEKLLYLAVAPLASGASVTAETVVEGTTATTPFTGNAYAKVDFDEVADVATSAAVAISADSASNIAFKLPAANYTAILSGSGAVTSGGGFDTNNIEAYQSYQGDYTNDPVAAFTLIGSVNKYADWTGVTLPEVTLTFTLTELNDLEYDELEVDPATENMVVGGGSISDATNATAAYSETDEDWSLWASTGATSGNGGIDAAKLSNVKVDGIAVTSSQYTITAEGWFMMTWDQLSATGYDTNAPIVTLTFTHDGTDYVTTLAWTGPQNAYIETDDDFTVWASTGATSGNGGIDATKLSNVSIDGVPVASSIYSVTSEGWLQMTWENICKTNYDQNAATITVAFLHNGTYYKAVLTW